MYKKSHMFYPHFGIELFDGSKVRISLDLTWASSSLSAEKLEILKLIFLHLEQFHSKLGIVIG